MKKLIIEVGSTVTKVDLYNGETLERIKVITIQFKKNYKENNSLKKDDIQELIKNINELKNITENIYICGTSIFRNLKDEELNAFLDRFRKETNLEFHVISSEKENELTVKGVARLTNKRLGVMIGGGGSTEIAIYDNGIIESVISSIGVIDIMEKFPDLADNFATTPLEDVMKYIKDNLKLPENKVDILVLAGGNHKYFAEESGISYEKNTIYEDNNAPIMMDIKTRIKDTKKYYKEISLDDIRSRVDDPKWWEATRAMCAFALVVAEKIDAKYIIPTDIGMAYGLIDE